MKTKIILFIAMIFISLKADPFSILPGTKAKGMAGAYSSLVEDTTAGYYNPAGYTVFFIEEMDGFNIVATAEIIDILSFDDYSHSKLKDKLTKKLKPFVGISFMNANYGFGLSAYSIYDYILKDRYTTVENTYETRTSLPTTLHPIIDFFHQKADIFQVGGAYNIFRVKQFNSLVSIGTSLGAVFIGGEYGTDTRRGKLRQYIDEDRTKKYNLAFSKSIYSGMYKDVNIFYGAGMKARLYDSDKYALNVGYSIKTKSESSIKSNKENFTATKDQIKGSSILEIPSWGVPESTNLGIAFNIKRDFGFFTFSYDNGIKKYSEVTNNEQSNVSTNMFGMEVSLPQYDVQLRAGKYISKSQSSKDINADAITFGISTILRSISSTLDVSLELKNYNKDKERASLNLISFSFNHEI